MAEPTRYVNNLGEERWQPTLSNGQVLVHIPAEWEPDRTWSWLAEDGPVLYRSRKRAERITRRQERRDWRKANKHTWRRSG